MLAAGLRETFQANKPSGVFVVDSRFVDAPIMQVLTEFAVQHRARCPMREFQVPRPGPIEEPLRGTTGEAPSSSYRRECTRGDSRYSEPVPEGWSPA